MNSTATVTTSPSAAATSRRDRRAMRQQQSSSADSGGGTATATATTAAEAARAARRNRIAGTGIATSPRANSSNGVSSPASGGIHKPSIGSGSGHRIGGSPSVAEVAAAFEALGTPSMNGTGNSSGNTRQNGTAAGINGASVNSSVRRSGNTILSSSVAAAGGNANATNAAAGSGTRAAMPSPQDVADEFVGRRRLQQQYAQQQQQQQQQGPAGMTATTPARYALVESPSQTPSTSNRKLQQSLRVDTRNSTRSANGTTATPHSVASPDAHLKNLGSVNSSELGSLASPAAASTVADSLAYSRSQNTSKDNSSGFGSGADGFGDDMLSGQATNDIPATTKTAAKTMNNGGSGFASAGDGGWSGSMEVRQNGGTLQPQPQPQPRSQMRNGTQSTANSFGVTGSTLTADSVDDNFDDVKRGGGSNISRYDDLSKLSSRYNRPDRVMAPVDEKPQLANPNDTSRSFDSYENKSLATAITYGQHDTNGAVGGGVGASTAATNGGSSAKRDGTSIDVVTQSFSPTHQSNTYPSSQASVGAGGSSRPGVDGTFDDEDTNTVGSQLTDDRSWSRSVNLRQQHLRAQGRDYDDDADSRGSRRRRKSGKNGGKESGGGGGDMAFLALNANDLNHFREQIDQPQVKAALGASAAVVAGAAIFGPAGVLLGAGAVGLGVGVMRMPEDQREQLKKKATAAAQQTFESAQIAADAMGTTCATACVESGVAEKIDPKFAKFVEDGAHNGCGTTIAATDLIQHNPCVSMDGDILSPLDGDTIVDDDAGASKKAPNSGKSGQSKGANESGAEDSGSENQMPKRRRKVACMRKGRIVPLGQIHSLDPARQPKAWLDVMASANTSRDEKDEAMEELSIFIKDKYTAHALLDEGILDSLLYIIACFFRTRGSAILRDSPDGIMPMSARSDPHFLHAKKAANCCVNLGKAHCAIVHTETDDLLMSAYSHGAVPIERQLAQMLHEVPHHTSLPTSPANKESADGGDVAPSREVAFTLTELSLQHAERLSMSILALLNGRIVL